MSLNIEVFNIRFKKRCYVNPDGLQGYNDEKKKRKTKVDILSPSPSPSGNIQRSERYLYP